MTRVRPAARGRLTLAASLVAIIALLAIVPWRLVASEPPPTVGTNVDFETAQLTVENNVNLEVAQGEAGEQPAKPRSAAHQRAVEAIRKHHDGVSENGNQGVTVVWTGDDSRIAELGQLEDIASLIIDVAKLTPAGVGELKKLSVKLNVQLMNANDEQLVSLEDWQGVRVLTIQGQSMTDAGLASIATLPNLTYIAISAGNPGEVTQITDTGIAALKSCIKLTQLGIEGSPKVTGSGLGALAEVPKLHTVWLAQSGLDDQGLTQVAKLAQLKGLIIDGKHLTSAGYAALSRMTNLQRLTLSDGTTFDDRAAQCLAPLTKLRSLGLFDVRLTDAGLAPLAALTQLRTLDIWKGAAPYSDAGIAHLKGLTQLRRLLFSTITEVTDAGLKNLAGLKQLRELQVPSKNITDDGLQALAGCTALTQLNFDESNVRGTGLVALKAAKLTFLSLDQAQVDDQGIVQIATFGELSELSLNNTRVTNAGLPTVAKLGKLTTLNLMGTKVTADGLAALTSLKSLRMLSVQNTDVTKDAGEKLLKQMPTLTIAGEGWHIGTGLNNVTFLFTGALQMDTLGIEDDDAK